MVVRRFAGAVIMVVLMLVAVTVSPSTQLQKHETDTRGDEQTAHDRVLSALDR